MIGTYARRLRAPDYPWAPTREQREAFFKEIVEHWGGPVGLDERAPSVADDPAFREWWATYLRMGASPAAAIALTRMNAEIDVRHILPTIRVPTLVLHRTGDRCLLVEEGRYVASLIPGARFVELPGDDHLPFVGDQDAILDEIERFLAGARTRVDADRVLVTMLCVELARRRRRHAIRDVGARAPAQPRRRASLALRREAVRIVRRSGLRRLRRTRPRNPMRCAIGAEARRTHVAVRARAAHRRMRSGGGRAARRRRRHWQPGGRPRAARARSW